MKTKYPALFANGSNEDKLNAMVTKGGVNDGNSDIDDNERFVINLKSGGQISDMDGDSGGDYVDYPVSRKSGGYGDIVGCSNTKQMGQTSGAIGVKSAANLTNLKQGLK